MIVAASARHFDHTVIHVCTFCEHAYSDSSLPSISLCFGMKGTSKMIEFLRPCCLIDAIAFVFIFTLDPYKGIWSTVLAVGGSKIIETSQGTKIRNAAGLSCVYICLAWMLVFKSFPTKDIKYALAREFFRSQRHIWNVLAAKGSNTQDGLWQDLWTWCCSCFTAEWCAGSIQRRR